LIVVKKKLKKEESPIKIPPASAEAPPSSAYSARCYVLRVWKDFDAKLSGMDFNLELTGSFGVLVSKLRLGDRILLIAWNSGRTGKARLVKVVGIQAPAQVFVEQTWGWKSNAPDTEALLRQLSLTGESLELPVFGATAEAGTPKELCLEVLTPVTGAAISDALKELLDRPRRTQ
jgi:hypothetical protein